MPANTANQLFLHMGHVIPMGQSDLLADDAVPKYRKGQFSYVMDDYGLRIFRYLHNMKLSSGVWIKGGLYSRSADVNVTLGATSGSTTTAIIKAAAWTANTLAGRIYIHLTNATSAGAAPEGETALVVSNTAGQINLDTARPLSAAPSVGADTTRVFSIFDVAAAASGDLAAGGTTVPNVMGIAMQTVAATDWGVLQTYGMCPDALVKASTAIGPGPVAADAEQATVATTTTLVSYRLVIGWCPYAITASNATGFGMYFINVHSPALPIASL